MPGGIAVGSREGETMKWGEQEAVYHHDVTMAAIASISIWHGS
jgi:hypothetical protein